MNTKLYVGNLSANTTERELQRLFSTHGNVAEVSLAFERPRRRPLGFAVVTMATHQGAQAALALNGKDAGGRALAVTEYLLTRRDLPAAVQKEKNPWTRS